MSVLKTSLFKRPPRLTRDASNTARDIVQQILSHGPMRAQEIYHKAHDLFPDAKCEVPPRYDTKGTLSGSKSSDPPHPEHAIRSMKYLKRVVLEDMKSRKQVEKFHLRYDEEKLKQTWHDQALQNKTVKNRLKRPLRLGDWLWRLTSDKPQDQGS